MTCFSVFPRVPADNTLRLSEGTRLQVKQRLATERQACIMTISQVPAHFGRGEEPGGDIHVVHENAPAVTVFPSIVRAVQQQRATRSEVVGKNRFGHVERIKQCQRGILHAMSLFAAGLELGFDILVGLINGIHFDTPSRPPW